ncbi:MAG: TldD/PmbA family protein [Methanobrevibacter sp.]|jgi:PmbA protein|nr:TldD/PmbA family protein [Candidatus Methanovirga aequatorialis]
MLYELAEEGTRHLKKYVDEFEIFIEKDKSIELSSEKSVLNFAKREDTVGIGIRVIKDNKTGFAYTTNPEKIIQIAEKAFLNCKSNELDKNFAFAKNQKYKKVEEIFDKGFDLDEGTDLMNTILNTVEDEKCESTSAGFFANFTHNLILNSNDLSVENSSSGFSGYLTVNAYKNNEKSTAYDSIFSPIFNLNGEKLGRDVCKIAKNSIGGVKVDNYDMDVVLDYAAASGLLNPFISGFNGDNVRRSRSILKDKLGTRIVSEELSIYDDGRYPGGFNSSVSDGEGTSSQRTTLVKDGILKNFIFDIYSANKCGVESTGNGFRGYSSTPTNSHSNVIFNFKNSIDISEIDKGFLVTDVLGAHTANPISGDFSVESNNSFLIENGEIAKPVKKAMIVGNIFDGLSNCQGLKSDLRQKGSFIIPKILSKNLKVVG